MVKKNKTTKKRLCVASYYYFQQIGNICNLTLVILENKFTFVPPNWLLVFLKFQFGYFEADKSHLP